MAVMAALKPTFVRTVLTHGIGFGLLMAFFFWARDAIAGHVPPWPIWALVDGLEPLLGGFLYGSFYWWLDRRSSPTLRSCG